MSVLRHDSRGAEHDAGELRGWVLVVLFPVVGVGYALLVAVVLMLLGVDL